MDDAEARNVIVHLGHDFNPWWTGGSIRTGIPRDGQERALRLMHSGQALAILGMRQAGKSTFMRQLVAHLLRDGVPARDIFFVNFDEPSLAKHLPGYETLQSLFDAYRVHQRPVGRPYLFLDEVQNLDHWARWVRTALETDRAVVVLSGSASRLLEPELGSVLTGRTRRLDFAPFSFHEFLEANRASSTSSDPDSVERALRGYLRRGGLPAAVLEADERDANDRLKQYFEDILARDVVARHGVRSVGALRMVAAHLLEQTARPFTYQRLKGVFDLGQRGKQLGIDQLRHYVDHLVEARMLGVIEQLERRPAARLRAPRKVYARDTGLRNAVAATLSDDLGWLAETAVYNALLSLGHHDIYYFKGERDVECDFVLWSYTRASAAVQVTFGAGPLPERERVGLLTAMKAFDLNEGLLLTRDLDQDETRDGLTIHYRPLRRWLLDPDLGLSNGGGV